MRAAVFRGWVPFTGGLEGVVPWAYLDILGLVTVAIGNLIDPVSAALGLPFVRPDGSPAESGEIAAEWYALKSMWCGTTVGAANCPWKGTKVCLAHRGHLAAKSVAKLRLTPEGVSRIVLGKLTANDAALIHRFPDFPDWCADAQLFAHSMSWACGTGFHFPLLEAALRAQDYEAALRNCHINDAGPDRIEGNADDNWGLKPRNKMNTVMLMNAAKVQSFHLDPEELLFPIPGAALIVPPETHAPPRQDPAPLWEETMGSGGIIHPAPEWPSYAD